MIDHLRLESDRGGYEAAAAVADRLAALRAGAARLLGAETGEVVVTGSDTQSWTKALWGFVLGGGVTRGDRLVVDRIAYDSHYLGLMQVCELTGADIEVVPSTGDGTIDLEALDRSLASGRAALAAAHPRRHPPGTGQSGRGGRRASAAGRTSPSSSMRARASDSSRSTCAASTATSPPPPAANGCGGRGAPACSSSVPNSPSACGRRASAGARPSWEDADHYRLRPGADRFLDFEVPIAAHLGLGVAIDHALELGIDSIAARVQDLGEQLRHQLAEIGRRSPSTTAGSGARAS